jgi:MFS family permease
MIGVMSAGVAARLMARVGARRMLIAGMTVIIAALAMLSGAGIGTTYAPWLLIAYAMLGAGGGMSFLPLLTISMSDVPMADAGLASGFSNATMQVGGALGLAAMGTISSAHAQTLIAAGTPASLAAAGGFQLAYVLAAVCAAAGLAVVLAVLRPSVVARRSETVRAEVEKAEAEAA